MKLNYKRTIFVGFAFFLICAFWQAYDNIIPLILTNKFGLSQTVSGAIMALDNILALFMLPLFGALSDRCKSPKGRRTPFIVVGTIVAVIAFILLSVIDGIQLKQISNVAAIDDPAAMKTIYQEVKDEKLLTPDGESFVLSEKYTEEEFAQVKSTIPNGNSSGSPTSTNPEYTKYVVPARQAVIRDITSSSPRNLILFMVLLLITLVAMSTFRSPAVALMPDVTIKPLRSKANAVINLMGSAGGIIVLALGIVFATSALKNSFMNYMPYFVVIALLMLVALAIFKVTVNEPKFVIDMQEESLRLGLTDWDQAAEDTALEEGGRHKAKSQVGRKLTPEEKKSLILILASIVFWFMGYNAVTSKYSVYASTILHKDYNLTLIIAQVAAIISYLPVGIIASKIGRKKTIIAGVVMLAAAFGIGATMRAGSPTILMNCIFALAGIAWATINVNSFPMVVEMCSEGDVGKFTGFYYTASMAAQVVTPIFSGFLMDKLGMTVLFPYAALFSAVAILTMIGVKHGDSRPEAKKGLEALEDLD